MVVQEFLPFSLRYLLERRYRYAAGLRQNMLSVAQQTTRAVLFLHQRGCVHGHVHDRNVRFLRLQTRIDKGAEQEVVMKPFQGGAIKLTDHWYLRRRQVLFQGGARGEPCTLPPRTDSQARLARPRSSRVCARPVHGSFSRTGEPRRMLLPLCFPPRGQTFWLFIC